ncbi:MAG: protein kinase [Acidimicrobiales bacterium]|nr:protein kinase [Acidimicrobiales bacterium]
MLKATMLKRARHRTGRGVVPGDVADPVLGLASLRDVSVIASGSSSTVYRAYQERFDRMVAVKVIAAGEALGENRRRFERECLATGRLSGHPNIVTVLDAGATPAGQLYLTMDLLERGSLADLVARRGALEVDEVLRLGVKLCGALETAHAAGILHRDVKPENVLLSRFGEPALADFGIAGLMGGATVVQQALTPVHAAPEVLEGAEASPASDVYSLGSVLYTALGACPPYRIEPGETLLALIVRILREEVAPLRRAEVPAEVEETVRWAMAKDPKDRPASAAALGERLRRIQYERGSPPTELVIGAPELHGPVGAAVDRGPSELRPVTAARPPRRPTLPGEIPGMQWSPGHAIDGGTVARPIRPGREVEPDAPPEAARRRVPRWALRTAIGVAGALAVVAVALVLTVGHHPAHPSATPRSSPFQSLRPTGVQQTPLSRTAVDLRWIDHARGRFGYVVFYDPKLPDGHETDAVAGGTTSYVVSGLSPGVRYCFRIALVTGEDESDWPVSEQVCTS